jgi:hypothetical protein
MVHPGAALKLELFDGAIPLRYFPTKKTFANGA